MLSLLVAAAVVLTIVAPWLVAMRLEKHGRKI
jgi:hypothetical protein